MVARKRAGKEKNRNPRPRHQRGDSKNTGESRSGDKAKAEAVIGYLTYINGDIFAKEDNRVKLAVCAAAEVVHYHNNQASANGNQAAGVKSETNDGYSVTYITEGQDGQTAEELLRKKIL